MITPDPRRELHPDVVELLALSGNPIDSIEQDNTGFEEDLLVFQGTMESWQRWTDGQFVGAITEIPEDSVKITNTPKTPFSDTLIELLELKKRGAPLLICQQATVESEEKLVEGYVGVYAVDSKVAKAIISLWPTHENCSPTPQNNLVWHVHHESIAAHYFDPNWRSRHPRAMERHSGFVWAEQNGLAVPAYMTSVLLRHYEYSLQKAKQEKVVQSGDPVFVDQFLNEYIEKDLTEERQLYEEFTRQLDDNGNRKFRPLSLEQIAGLALTSLHKAIENIPELNEKLGLEGTITTRSDQDLG